MVKQDPKDVCCAKFEALEYPTGLDDTTKSIMKSLGAEKNGDVFHSCLAIKATLPYADGDILQNENLLGGMKLKFACDSAMAIKVAVVTVAASVIMGSF